MITEDAVRELRNKHPGKYTEGYIRQFDKEWSEAVKTLWLSGQNLSQICLVPKRIKLSNYAVSRVRQQIANLRGKICGF